MPKRRGENTLEGGSNKKQKAGDDEHDIAGTYIMLVSNPFTIIISIVSLFFPQCFTIVSLFFPQCFPNVSLLFHYCFLLSLLIGSRRLLLLTIVYVCTDLLYFTLHALSRRNVSTGERGCAQLSE